VTGGSDGPTSDPSFEVNVLVVVNAIYSLTKDGFFIIEVASFLGTIFTSSGSADAPV
jgi:hypothetical protein